MPWPRLAVDERYDCNDMFLGGPHGGGLRLTDFILVYPLSAPSFKERLRRWWQRHFVCRFKDHLFTRSPSQAHPQYCQRCHAKWYAWMPPCPPVPGEELAECPWCGHYAYRKLNGEAWCVHCHNYSRWSNGSVIKITEQEQRYFVKKGQ